MNVLFGSIVRDGMTYLPDYLERIDSFNADLVICEGDSTDGSYEYLKGQLPPDWLFKLDQRKQKYGSVDNPERWEVIANTWNYMLDSFQHFDSYDYFIYMEADLKWDHDTILSLLEGLDIFDAVAPMSMYEDRFYDIWGHRALYNGEVVKFQPNYPYHPSFERWTGYMPIVSAGSCIAMRIPVIKECRLSTEDAMIGHDIVKKGYTFMLDKTLKVTHP